ncbi:alpha/beta fold hydrolase [Variovorax guangxiensis]|uniref:Alpha/beta hydrolase n=1 Tax=Variovorax guangxiensis TaxID=1775474 RepID=A0A502DQQ6_9BURK|nr:alpha/beta hydrolase [Variovorax guangxiensis]RZI67401.1 MAG: alpha/beta hydrolase [Variovorax sp.]TPG23159.1 alpha/beta hydrolase [Variovorax ginsengisoli]TPG27707.1 alpha/beta hydrolase [Variovorax guangxiensis]
MYVPRRLSLSEHVPVRTLRYHLRSWGTPSAARPPLVLLHGWMDVSASWQFVVDAMADDRFIVAPDWRGFGQTDGGPVDNYWLPDYLADLDWLLDHVAGDTPVDLVGHSMGGNIAMQYAGVRPQRIRRLVNLEGFGMPERHPEEAPARYGQWIDQLKRLHRGELALQGYADVGGVARRLMKTNPRLTQDKAEWLAGHWAAQRTQADGSTQWGIQGDASHKVINANIYRLDEALALYAAIAAPVLAVEASDDSLARWAGRYTLEDYRERLKSVRDVRTAVVQDAGHMLHHDQPETVARQIEDFLR